MTSLERMEQRRAELVKAHEETILNVHRLSAAIAILDEQIKAERELPNRAQRRRAEKAKTP